MWRKKISRDESKETCFMVQGNDSLDVNSDTQLDDYASSSGDDIIDPDELNEELSIVCENLLEKCHTPLLKIRWSGDATRVGNAYT